MNRSLRRLALAAALPAVLAAVALPAGAHAATVQVVTPTTETFLIYTADPGEANNVRVSLTAAGVVISDQVPIRPVGSACRLDAAGDAVCPSTVDGITVMTKDGNDTIQYTAPHRGFVAAGNGADRIFAGLRQAGFGRQIEPVQYNGNDRRDDTGLDTVSYSLADRPVRVDLSDGGILPLRFEDGRPGIDREHIFNDIEIIEGSNFSDPQLFGSDRDETFRGLRGDDVIGTGGGNDLIDESDNANGSDTLNGGNGANDRVLYTGRSGGVNVSLDGLRNDGAPGENDDVRQSVEHVNGTDFGDTLIGNSLANSLIGFGGNDRLEGRGGNDDLAGYGGRDSIFGHEGNDALFARDGESDVIVDCGSGSDTAHLDSFDGFVGCEKRPAVGRLRLAPKTAQAKAGSVVQVQLSWRHPEQWQRLRAIELRLEQDGRRVGKVTISPRAGRIVADGAVSLVRQRTSLSRRGATVAARLALRLDETLAGARLVADVEGVDTRGARQVERGAGAIRVTR